MLLKQSLLLVVLTTATVVANSSTKPPFGSCPEGRNECSECYLALKVSLLSRDDNVKNLSLAFYPPRAVPPEFVTVNYYFDNITDSPQVWFWTRYSSYLFFPLETFQYLSLFFGKIAPQVSKNVTLTLDAECNNTKHENLVLMTQRLKDFVQYKKYNPEIDDNYFATSEKNEEGDNILKDSTAKLILALYCVGTALVMLITVILMVIYFYTKQWDKKLQKISKPLKSNKESKSKIFGIAFISWILNAYILILDILAVITMQNPTLMLIPNEGSIILRLPCIVLAFVCLGNLGNFVWFILILCSLCECREKLKNRQYCILALSTLGPLLSLLLHIPYISIAFLNDAYHASSIFIAYTVIGFILFGAVELNYGTCQGALANQGELKFDKISTNDIKLKHEENTLKGNFTLNMNEITTLDYENLTIKTKKSLDINSITYTSRSPLPHDIARNNELTLYNQSDGNKVTLTCTTKLEADRTSSLELILNLKQFKFTVCEVDAENKTIKINVAPCDAEGGENDIPTLDVEGGELLCLPFHCSSCCTKNSTRITCCSCRTKTSTGIICTFISLILLFVVVLLGLIAMVTAVLVTVPIHNAFTNAPNRLVGFYQIVLVFIGAYVIYRKFFKKKSTIEKAVKNRDKRIDPYAEEKKDWKQLSKKERVAEFYSTIVDIVADYREKHKPTSQSE